MRKFPPALKENKLEINPYGLTIFAVVFGSTHTEYASYHNRKVEKNREFASTEDWGDRAAGPSITSRVQTHRQEQQSPNAEPLKGEAGWNNSSWNVPWEVSTPRLCCLWPFHEAPPSVSAPPHHPFGWLILDPPPNPSPLGCQHLLASTLSTLCQINGCSQSTPTKSRDTGKHQFCGTAEHLLDFTCMNTRG